MSDQVLDSSIIDRLEKHGGKELKAVLIRMYLDKSSEKMDLIHQGLSKSTLSEIERAAHSLISSAGNLGGMQVSGLAVKLEQAAGENDLASIEKLIPELDRAEKALTTQLSLELEKS